MKKAIKNIFVIGTIISAFGWIVSPFLASFTNHYFSDLFFFIPPVLIAVIGYMFLRCFIKPTDVGDGVICTIGAAVLNIIFFYLFGFITDNLFTDANLNIVVYFIFVEFGILLLLVPVLIFGIISRRKIHKVN